MREEFILEMEYIDIWIYIYIDTANVKGAH